MTVFQLILLAITAYFAFEVYKHIQTLEDKPKNKPKPFDDGGIQSDIKEWTPKTIYTIQELVDKADKAFLDGNLDEALKILREANYNKPFDAEILYKIAFILYKQQDYKNSIEALEDALKGDDKDPAIYALLASNYRALKDYQKASFYIKEALYLDRDNAMYHFNYANILLDLNHKDEAKKEYQKALELDSSLEAAKEELEKLS
jgi:tetratricopeptide (TPR) repeat protein